MKLYAFRLFALSLAILAGMAVQHTNTAPMSEIAKAPKTQMVVIRVSIIKS